MTSSSISGLALSIRKAEESETFDLGGQNVSTITNTIQSAFAEPLPLRGKMIRITFVTGAGKQARQKYDEGAARAVTSTLREMGFEEDRAASCVVECAGTFKTQHDTGKNLKTVVVFPKIIQQTDNDDGDMGNGATKQTLIPEGCPAHQIAMSSTNVFKSMLKSKCPSWSQKKGCYAALEQLKHMVDLLDEKLMKGTPLEEAEQDFYDNITSLDEKLALCKEALHEQVESGSVTKFEKDALVQHNAERLATLTEEMSSASGQKLEKLKQMKAKATQRKEMLHDIEPIAPHKLKYETEINKLWREVVPMLQLEEKCRGRLLSVKETQIMAQKDEIMEEIEAYEDASRGWFEDNDAFDARVKAIRAAFTAKLAQKSKSKKAAGSYAAAVTSARTTTVRNEKWVTPVQDSKKKAWGGANKKKKKNLGDGIFAAMMAKDDSDSDEEADNHVSYDESDNGMEQQETAAAAGINPTVRATAVAQKSKLDTPSSNSQNETTSSVKKKGKKKNKKSKGGIKVKKDEADMPDDELLNEAVAANAAAKKEKEEAQEVSHPAIAFLKNYFIPFILSFIAFIVSLIFGKPKQKKR